MVPTLVSAWVCCLFICLFGFSQDLQRRWIARSSTLSFYILGGTQGLILSVMILFARISKVPILQLAYKMRSNF